MALTLPTAAQAAAQIPTNTFSPTSSPLVNTTNGLSYVYDPGLGVWNVSSPGGTAVSSFSGGTTGLTPTAATTGPVTLGGTLAVANGGTGQTTATAALNALLPSQGGNANKALITNGTSVSWGDAGFLTGTRMPFAQAAAPTGWTQDTSAAVNDSSIRLVTSAGGGTGGALNFSTVFVASYPISGTVTFTGGNTGSTTLSGAQLAAHTHDVPVMYMGSPLVRGFWIGDYNGYSTTGGISGGGGGSGHAHSLAGASSPASLNGAFNVKYVNMIICTKN